LFFRFAYPAKPYVEAGEAFWPEGCEQLNDGVIGERVRSEAASIVFDKGWLNPNGRTNVEAHADVPCSDINVMCAKVSCEDSKVLSCIEQASGVGVFLNVKLF
jgi:hypothetical protein